MALNGILIRMPHPPVLERCVWVKVSTEEQRAILANTFEAALDAIPG